MSEGRTRRARPRDAASLVLLRGEGRRAEVLLGRRAPRNHFMPNVYVFPGGAVQPEDARRPIVSELTPEVARALSHRRRGAGSRALGVAALRETFEETGLAIGALRGEELAPDLARLGYLARAITPSDQSTRFHARFFVAEAASARGALRSNGELLDLRWVRLSEARDLPIVDVTGFVLDEVEHHVSGTKRRAPLIYYRSGKATFR